MVSSAPRSRHARVASALASLVMLAGLLPAGVAAAPPSGSPTLLSPTEGQTVSSNPTFSWTAVGGAAKYRVQVSTGGGVQSFAYNVDTVNSRRRRRPTCRSGRSTGGWPRPTAVPGIGSVTNGQFTKAWGDAPRPPRRSCGDTLNFPTEPIRFPLGALCRREDLHARDRRRRRLHRRELVHDEQHELHAHRAADDRPDVPLAVRGNVRDRRRRERLDAETSQYTYTWPTTPELLEPADDVARACRHRLQLGAGRSAPRRTSSR